MAQILDPLPPEQSTNIICCYVNTTSKIQIARIANVANWYFERVVFPGQRLVFEAPLQAQMEIHTGMMASSILSDTIPCERLAIDEPSTKEFHTDSIGIDTISTKPMVQSINTKTENTTKPLTIAG
ncbi:DUF1830 domain-containing protein [Umezakia ovalisporum]|jgi:hypothetical protein|uniref:DUF1830 domain-containing protein n=2 Tax=Umezakia ovalisporum TaxID=75695 RepID=A0AA43GZQ3_9CYAN|nr:DUF1830 domain-containing protein [Umezakia ovalisporum]MBI1240072.1 DUF1830 domain-containing protein [Nostoc sp. RI_552]MDH6056984.1 DUF1830 domain-containing protein [Umezakia ovalisporum FSS-43]MDH6064450.1 DUF1830 domain-containing protein [Umezakia ovalisporum FSS-62]MDH6068434.1 DUF1830 domain-containing protein [Umezakia ovalisporum APH033B]MDH6071175.1 DUF1830 domain-containing protein [Umezakia ovalisporum CobakiLakeA]